MGMEWEAGHSRCTLSDMEWIDNEVLLYSTGNYIQYPEINHNGKEAFKKENIYMCKGFTLLHSRNQQNLGNRWYRNFKNWLKSGLKIIKRLSLLKTLSQWCLQTLFAGLLTSFPVLHTILSLHTPPYLETRATSLKCKLINILTCFKPSSTPTTLRVRPEVSPWRTEPYMVLPHHPSDISTTHTDPSVTQVQASCGSPNMLSLLLLLRSAIDTCRSVMSSTGIFQGVWSATSQDGAFPSPLILK